MGNKDPKQTEAGLFIQENHSLGCLLSSYNHLGLIFVNGMGAHVAHTFNAINKGSVQILEFKQQTCPMRLRPI